MISLFDSILKQDTSIDFYGDQSMLSQISTQHTLDLYMVLVLPIGIIRINVNKINLSILLILKIKEI